MSGMEFPTIFSVINESWMRKNWWNCNEIASQVGSINIFSLGLPIFLYKFDDIVEIRKVIYIWRHKLPKAELLQQNRTQFPSLGIFVSKKVGNQKN